MSGNRHIDDITDLLMIVISPALVMLMVGSLCYFAINCFYVGSFDGRLYFATGLFVFAAVLVSRISIEEGREYASMFAVPLSITTLLSLMRYTDAGIWFLAPMVAFIWWSTDKLTWDCTVVDHKKDASGKGLLKTIGMDDEPPGESDDDAEIDLSATTSKEKADEKSFWQRWVERRQRKHTPGVWVIYFGMAAIPIFGIGQTLLPPEQFGPSFLLLCTYVASALALLMATSFLQMRRYLNQRRLELSDGMAATWLSSGGMLILGLMLACLFLPRPNTGYSFVDQFSKIGSHDQRASRFAFGKQDAVEDGEVEGSGESEQQAERDSDRGSQTSSDAERGNKSGDNAKQKGSKQSQRGKRSEGEDSQSESENSQNNDSQSKRSERNQSNERKRDSSEQEGDESNRDRDQSDSQDSQDDQRRDSSERKGDSSEQGGDESNDSDAYEETDYDKDSNASQSSNQFKFKPPELPDVLSSFSMPSIPKLVYFVIIGALVLFVFIRYGRQIGEAISHFIRDFLEMLRRLFGGKPRSREVAEEPEAVEPEEPRRPFSSYPNPFTMGTADQFSPQQLVNYTFEALQAWAYERNCGRADEQTPLEFASQLALSNKQVGNSAKNLAQLYNQVAYAPGSISKDALGHLKKIWSVLR